MAPKQREKFMIRLSLLLAGLIACYWAVYYLIVGQVPLMSQSVLSLEVSRWVDVLFGPIVAVVFVLRVTNREFFKQDGVFYEFLSIAIFVGPIVGIIFTMRDGLFYGLTAGTAVFLVVSVVGSIMGLLALLLFVLVTVIFTFPDWLVRRKIIARLGRWLIAAEYQT